LLAFLFLGVA